MSYTGHAQLGNQTVVAISGTAIGGILSFVQSGKQNRVKPVTNLLSNVDEFISTGLLSPGKFDLTYTRQPSDTGQQAVTAAFDAKSKPTFTITLPLAQGQTTRGDVYSFSALVVELDDISMVAPTKPITTKASLKVSGAISYTAGS